jgi:prephenate dehydrogenase
MKWADELLPEKIQYAGFTPLLSPLYLHKEAGGIESAHADLFDHGLIAITSSPNTDSSVLKTAAKLAKYLKAAPLFADPLEVDSYMAALHVIPQLISGALSKTTSESSGWQEGRKFAGRAYAQVTNPIATQDNPTSLASAAVLNKENTLRVLDDIITELQILRNGFEKEDLEAVEAYLTQAREGRDKWWKERGAANWSGDNFPKLDGDLGGFKPFGRLVGSRRKKEDRNK